MNASRFRRRALFAFALSTSLTGPTLAAAQTTAPAARSDVVAAEASWRAGDPAGALAALATRTDPAASLLKAELLDAAGRVADAGALYRQVLPTADPALRRRIELRLAIIAALRRPDSLTAYAAQQPRDAQQRLAELLALLGRPKAALALAGEGTTLAARLTAAQWALAAGDATAAKQAAQGALAMATTVDDQRYALALLVEAYRAGGDLAAVLPFLTQRPQGTAVAQATVDVLLELGRTAPAIARIARSTDPALRARLGGLLDQSGDPAAAQAEYRRLIAADPRQSDLTARLAASYLVQGREAEAVATYRRFFAANRGRVDVLIAGAKAMIAMGLQDQAVAMLAGNATDPAVAAATHLFLFETQLDRGDTAQALAELEAVRRADPRGLLLLDIADGYERLGRPAEALALLRQVEGRGGATGYDLRTRLAQLAAATGDDADALRRWQALWADTTLPARRSAIERQIVALAKRTGQLEAMARALSTRLDVGRLRAGEIDLLVALRLAQDDRRAAADAIRRFAARSGAGEAAGLDRLAQLYARVRDYDRLATTLERLIAVDPANRDAHVRQLILTRLRHDAGAIPMAERQAELDALMAQLTASDSPTFRATVYAQADLKPQAIEQLRRAWAAAPQDGEALGRLAAELARQNRRGEAIALLQYAAERSGDGPAFVAAIDGLIDTVAAADPDDAAVVPVLAWAKRRVLERIATDGAMPRLTGLLADIGATDADIDLQLRATEAGVAGAGERRGYVLRELATLSGGGVRDGGGVAMIGDPRRKLVYARRLLALGKSFPPDLYADLARTLLAQGDEAGAERAFAMMSGMGGLVNVDEAKGDAYAAAGRPRQALANYARALLQDQANFDLLVKTAILHERAGQAALARNCYGRGLRTLLARQPAVPLGARDERGLDVRRYYPTLVEGLLLNAPDAMAGDDTLLTDLNRRFETELARVGTASPAILADYPRLALLADLGQRIVDAGQGNAALAGWDAALDRRFAADSTYRRAATLHAYLTGRAATALPDAADWPLVALGVQADDTGNGELAFILALSRNDEAAATTMLAAALAQEEAARAPGAEASSFRQPLYLLLVADAMDRLPPERSRELILAQLQRSPARDAILFDLFRAAPDRFERLERIAGAKLLAPDELVELTIRQNNRPLGISLRASRNAMSGGSEWIDRFSPDQLIALYDGMVVHLARGEGDSQLGDLALDAVLRRPLDDAQQRRLSAILARDIAVVRDPQARSGMPLVGRLLLFDTAPANRAIVLDAARGVAAAYRDSALLPTILERWYAGDRQGAFVALATLADGARANGQQVARIDRAIEIRFPDIERQQVDAFLTDPHPTSQAAATVYRRFVAGDAKIGIEQRLALTQRMIALDPANPTYRERLLALQAERADWAALAPLLEARVQAEPDDRTAATMLALVYRLLDQGERAAAVANAAGVDPDDPDVIAQLLNRSRMLQGRSTRPAGLFGKVYDAYARKFPARPAVVALLRREGRPDISGMADDDRQLAPLLQVDAHDPATPPEKLRALWRQSLPLAADGDTARGRRALVQTLAAGTMGDGAAAALLARPDMTAELQRYPRVMAPADQARQQLLYAVGAYGPVRQGQGAAALATLLADLRSGQGDADLIRRLVALADRLQVPLAHGDLAALDARLRRMPVLATDDRLALARLYALAGDLPRAQAWLTAAFLQMLYPAGPLDNVDDLAKAMARTVAILGAWPDRMAACRIHADLAHRFEKRKLGPNGGDLPGLPSLEGCKTG